MPVELELDPSLRRNLPDGGAAFLDELSNELDEEHVRSVLLFGSVVAGEATNHSDIDLLIVLEDAAPDAYAETLRAACSELAAQYLGISNYANDPLGRVIDRQTGMFRSGFVTRECDVRAGDFPAIFNTSRVAHLLAPWRSVLAGVFETAVSIYGPAVRPSWDRVAHPLSRSVRELARDWLMTFLLALPQLGYALVSPRAIHYSLEAYKWTVYTCAYHVSGSPASGLADALDAVPSLSPYDRWFRSLRDEPRTALSFLLLTPLAVSLVHLAAIGRVVVERVRGVRSR